MLKFEFLPVRGNNYSRMGSKILYIVIHDTGNRNAGATARNHRNYVGTNSRGASAHYFVDDTEICQFIGDSRSAGAVGDGKGKYGITNRNSISVEICINSDGDYSKTYFNAVELVKTLMLRFNIKSDNVVRHFDASRKICPGHMFGRNWEKWKQFKRDIEEPRRININLNGTSVATSINRGSAAAKPKLFKKSDNYMHHGLFIIETTVDKLYTQFINGKTIRDTGAYGINGVFFDTTTAPVTSANSICAIAINGGKPIGPNADKNHYKKNIKRATFIYGENNITIERINNINEVKRKVDFAVGGVGLYPSFDPKLEKIPADILRKTNHTGVAFKGDKVFLINSIPMTMAEFKNRIIELGIDGAVALDGGGSTQMYYKNNFGIHTSRKLPSIVGIKA